MDGQTDVEHLTVCLTHVHAFDSVKTDISEPQSRVEILTANGYLAVWPYLRHEEVNSVAVSVSSG